MAEHQINFVNDLAMIRKCLGDRIRVQAAIDQPISAIEIGMKLCQRGFIGVNFDLRDRHERCVSHPLENAPKKMEHWSKAYMQAGQYGISFSLLNGKPCRLAPGAADSRVAQVFGDTLLSIVRDAKARKMFEPLPLAKECQLDITEFDWMWAWPTHPNEIGQKNLFHRIRAVRLPQ